VISKKTFFRIAALPMEIRKALLEDIASTIENRVRTMERIVGKGR